MEVDHVQESPTDPPIRFVGEVTIGDEIPGVGFRADRVRAHVRNLIAAQDRLEDAVDMISEALVLDQKDQGELPSCRALAANAAMIWRSESIMGWVPVKPEGPWIWARRDDCQRCASARRTIRTRAELSLMSWRKRNPL